MADSLLQYNYTNNILYQGTHPHSIKSFHVSSANINNLYLTI